MSGPYRHGHGRRPARRFNWRPLLVPAIPVCLVAYIMACRWLDEAIGPGWGAGVFFGTPIVALLLIGLAVGMDDVAGKTGGWWIEEPGDE